MQLAVFSLKTNCFIRVAYFHHAANLLKYFDKLGLQKKKKIKKKIINDFLNRLTDCNNQSKFY